MTTVLFYLVIAAVIGLVVFFLAVLVFGRGEQMAPLDPRTSPAELPDHDIDAEDVRKIRFALALRGYRMSDVDWTLERLGDQIDLLRLENARLREPSMDPVGEALPEDRAPLEGSALLDEPVPGMATAGQQPSVAKSKPPEYPAREQHNPRDPGSEQRWGPPHSEDPEPSTALQHPLLAQLSEREAAPAVDR